jgi:nitrite reductase/ring-hydroxylating ferredoxin subunit
MSKIKICKLSQLIDKGYIKRWIDELNDEIILFRNENKIYIKSSICPHFGGPISYEKNKNYLFCYWHGLKFGLDGKCLNQKSFKPCLNNYKHELKNKFIYLIKNENS